MVETTAVLWRIDSISVNRLALRGYRRSTVSLANDTHYSHGQVWSTVADQSDCLLPFPGLSGYEVLGREDSCHCILRVRSVPSIEVNSVGLMRVSIFEESWTGFLPTFTASECFFREQHRPKQPGEDSVCWSVRFRLPFLSRSFDAVSFRLCRAGNVSDRLETFIPSESCQASDRHGVWNGD